MFVLWVHGFRKPFPSLQARTDFNFHRRELSPVNGNEHGLQIIARLSERGDFARDAGIALLTEDRKRDGLLFNLPVGANITIGNLDPLSASGMVRGDRERSAVLEAMRQLNVKASSPQASVAHLSGGNQQKLLFARVLMRAPKVLLLDEPTKGVDAATRQEIYRLVVELANKGVALIVVSSELEEVLGLCDRCLTIADGQVVDEFKRGEGGEDRVLRAVAAAQAKTVRAAS